MAHSPFPLSGQYSRRPRRSHEWSDARIVTFIVTLAAHRNVTLAARCAGMSRKSAYALKSRDSAFAAAWDAACLTAGFERREGDKVHEVHDPSLAPPMGDKRPLGRGPGGARRDALFASLRANAPERAARSTGDDSRGRTTKPSCQPRRRVRR